MTGTGVDFVDGGAVLRVRPYTEAQWLQVRKAWWWHTAGMVFVLPYYAVIALTLWQDTSRQPLLRRAVWAGLLTVGALFLVGIPPFVVFSRRWYWMYRTRTDPVAAGVPTGRPGATSDLFELVAAKGAELADWVEGLGGRRTARPIGPARVPPRPVAAPRATPGPATRDDITRRTFPEPWASLVVDAARAVDRIRWASTQTQGPSAARIADAHREASAAADLAWHLAVRAGQITSAVGAMDIDGKERRFAALDHAAADPADIAATRRSLAEQRDAAERMQSAIPRLLGQLERLVAQLGEAAARAEELAFGTHAPDTRSLGLTNAIDGLVAIRSALDTVDTAAG
jgi:hypothetical protein